MNQYAIYLRKSRADLEAESRGEGETLARHRTALRALAKRRNLLVIKEYAELVTGDSIAARPQMQALLDDVKKGMYAGVIVNDVDRLGRGDSFDQEYIKITFAAAGCLIITPNKDIDLSNSSDQDMLEFSLFFARFEYRKISQRLMQGRIRSVEQGNYIGSRIPYGYRKITDGKKITLEPDPITAPIVQMMFKAYGNKEMGYAHLAKRLNQMGIRTNKGNTFVPNTVKRILTNPVYLGKNIYGRTKTVATIENGKKVKRNVKVDTGITIENSHPAIITQELFDKVQDILKEQGYKVPVNDNKKLSNPLAGLVVCSKCGKLMQTYGKGKNGGTLLCLTYGCPTKGTAVLLVEQQIVSILQSWVADYNPETIPEEEPSKQNETIEAFKHQLSTLQKRLERAKELVEMGVYSPAEYLEQKGLITSQMDTIKAEIAKATPVSAKSIRQQVIPGVKTVLDVYPYAQTVNDRNDLLKSIIEKVEYTKEKRTDRHTKAPSAPVDGMELVIYPKLEL